MYIEVDLGEGAEDRGPVEPVLAEPADCRRFHVAVRGTGDAAVLDRILRVSGVGCVDGDGEALVHVAAVRRLAAAAGATTDPGHPDDQWETDFAAMLGYAASKGWMSEDGDSIRAHVEWG
jgi:hypothetical protein